MTIHPLGGLSQVDVSWLVAETRARESDDKSRKEQEQIVRQLGLPEDALVLMFAGRLQPLKAPDVLLRAVAVLLAESPELRSREGGGCGLGVREWGMGNGDGVSRPCP